MFLVMELIRGETLASLLERRQVPVATPISILIPATRGAAERTLRASCAATSSPRTSSFRASWTVTSRSPRCWTSASPRSKTRAAEPCSAHLRHA